jgi:hypothetical protein
MKKIISVGFLILSLSQLGFAGEDIIAHGKSPQGKSYFPYSGPVTKKAAGWQDDGITNGVFEVAVSDGNLDVRYVDAAKRIKSSRADGGQVTVLNKGENEVSVLVYYPRNAIEVYTFYIDNEGKKKFILTQVRGGKNVLISKSAILTGSCSFIYFDKFTE